MSKNDLLQQYINTGFSPEQVNLMYQNLSATYDLLARLVSNDIPIMIQAYDDVKVWLNSYLSYCKQELN